MLYFVALSDFRFINRSAISAEREVINSLLGQKSNMNMQNTVKCQDLVTMWVSE